MLVGVFHFPTDYGIDVGELARELEAREFDSLFVCEHTHIPVSGRTPFPGGGELPKRYSHTHDPFVGLAFAAAATRTLRLGTGIALVPQRDPIVTAKSVASLDRLSWRCCPKRGRRPDRSRDRFELFAGVRLGRAQRRGRCGEQRLLCGTWAARQVGC